MVRATALAHYHERLMGATPVSGGTMAWRIAVMVLLSATPMALGIATWALCRAGDRRPPAPPQPFGGYPAVAPDRWARCAAKAEHPATKGGNS